MTCIKDNIKENTEECSIRKGEGEECVPELIAAKHRDNRGNTAKYQEI